MGWGDELMATGEARMLKEKFPDHKILIHNGPSKQMKFRREEMFRNNPYWTPFEKLKEGQTRPNRDCETRCSKRRKNSKSTMFCRRDLRCIRL